MDWSPWDCNPLPNPNYLVTPLPNVMVPYSPVTGKFHLFPEGNFRTLDKLASRSTSPTSPTPSLLLASFDLLGSVAAGTSLSIRALWGTGPPSPKYAGILLSTPGLRRCKCWSCVIELVVKGAQRRAPCAARSSGSDVSGILMLSRYFFPWENPFSVKMSGQRLLRLYKLIQALSITGSFCVNNPYKSYSVREGLKWQISE